MHSKKQGKSKSRKPIAEELQGKELAVNKEEIEKIIINYAKQGMAPALIGEKLKREHKVPYVKHMLGKRLVKILKENNLAGEIPSDLMTLMKKSVNLYAHLAKNKQDLHNRMRLQRIESKIWRLTKYYIREGVLPQTWRYDPKQAALLIKGVE